jgi:two-component system sensor histidine kinase YesM
MASGGTVLISGNLQNDSIVFRIEDNGCGIAPDRLQQLRQILAAHPLVGQNNPFMGLVNINDRIRLAYGNEYGVQVDSILRHGTTVTIRIPVIITKGCE